MAWLLTNKGEKLVMVTVGPVTVLMVSGQPEMKRRVKRVTKRKPMLARGRRHLI